MKLLVILTTLIVSSTALAASKDNPVYTQCTVEVPGHGNVRGVCRDTGEKHYAIITCDGKLLAWVGPDALPRKDGPTCGPEYVGYPTTKN